MKLKDIFRIIITPKCWSRNEKTNKQWNEELNKILDTIPPVQFDYDWNPIIKQAGKNFTIVLNNDIAVWVSNFPYCYGQKRNLDNSNSLEGLPSRTACFRLYDYLKNYKGYINEY